MYKKMCILYSVFIIILDQFTKGLVEKYLYFKQVSIIDDIFLLTYVQNKGGAWGMFNNIPVLFLILIPIIVIALIYFAVHSESKLEQISITMIISGAVGNYIDRLVRGYVIDFLNFIIWPVFNIADIFVVVGGVLLIISTIRGIKNGK